MNNYRFILEHYIKTMYRLPGKAEKNTSAESIIIYRFVQSIIIIIQGTGNLQENLKPFTKKEKGVFMMASIPG
jgi:hypothetical protein